MDRTCFVDLPIIDGHVHFAHPERIDEILSLLDESGRARANLVCIPNPDASTHNPAALYFKARYPERVYISAALEYAPVLADLDRGPALLAEQIRTLKACGFDGLKLIEGKPQVRKLLPYPLDGALYAGMWAVLEREHLPVILHVADPDEFWDAERCPDWARQSGWDYSDGSFPSREALYAEVDHILARHPNLKLILAHFGFFSADLENAARFLEAHPSVSFDLAPHIGMYHDFSRQPGSARDFFFRYQDRIIYGTDIDTRVLARGESGRKFMYFVPWLVRSVLEKSGVFTTTDGTSYHGLGLPCKVLEQVYHINFERIYLSTK
ncbi:MAG: amidohydrolase family protein [Anaerolineae bacterium]|nr:amidohydrolase family protein [Anaerolineae bacterium]